MLLRRSLAGQLIWADEKIYLGRLKNSGQLMWPYKIIYVGE